MSAVVIDGERKWEWLIRCDGIERDAAELRFLAHSGSVAQASRLKKAWLRAFQTRDKNPWAFGGCSGAGSDKSSAAWVRSGESTVVALVGILRLDACASSSILNLRFFFVSSAVWMLR